MKSTEHAFSSQEFVTNKIVGYLRALSIIVFTVFVVLLALLVSGCDRRSSDFGGMEPAERSLLAGYINDDPTIAFAALTNYHLKVLSSSGFSGRLQLPRALLATEARLFVLARHLGKSNDASVWLAQYTSNLNVVRAADAKEKLEPNEADVVRMVEKIDAVHMVRWKAKDVLLRQGCVSGGGRGV